MLGLGQIGTDLRLFFDGVDLVKILSRQPVLDQQFFFFLNDIK